MSAVLPSVKNGTESTALPALENEPVIVAACAAGASVSVPLFSRFAALMVPFMASEAFDAIFMSKDFAPLIAPFNVSCCALKLSFV